MKKRTVAGLELYYPAAEEEAAELVGEACQRTVELLRHDWGLQPPADCRVYVMTNWLSFLFHSAPLPWKAMMILTMPFWVRRIIGVWKVAGGWAQRYGTREAIGIKPPRLLLAADRSMGDQLFIRDTDPDKEAQHVTCHELTHAFAQFLRLPTWLHEGLSMMAVDRYAGRPTVRQDTLDRLVDSPYAETMSGTPKLRVQAADAMLYLYARGYWLTRYLETTQPGLLRDLFALGETGESLEAAILAALDAGPDFWVEIDAELVKTFADDR